jgi:Sulfotransferase domain
MLTNGFYQNLDQVDSDEIEFVCFGIPRSGSTLVYQLISALFPEGVAKTHQYCRHCVKTLVSFRDFRDVVVSLWRRSDPSNLRRRMRAADVDEFAALCQERVKALDRYFDRGGICPLRYEEFVADPRVIFSSVEKVFGTTVSADKIEELVRKYSLQKNREISERLTGFKQVDPATQIHGNHIYRGEVGSWRQFVDNDTAGRLEQVLRSSLLRYGYLS